MKWLFYSLACLCFWTPTGIFLGKANGGHGFVLTFQIQAIALLIFSVFLQFTDPPNYSAASNSSIAFAVANGIFAGFAYIFFLKSFEAAPGKVPEIELVTALYPITCVFLIWGIQQIRLAWLEEIVKIGFKEILGVCLIAAGFVSFFWQPEWTEKVKSFF